MSSEAWVSNGYVLSAPHGYQFHPQINTLVRSLTSVSGFMISHNYIRHYWSDYQLLVPSLQCVDLKVSSLCHAQDVLCVSFNQPASRYEVIALW